MNLLRSAVALSCSSLVVLCWAFESPNAVQAESKAAAISASTVSVSPRLLTMLAAGREIGAAAQAAQEPPKKTSETPLPDGKGKETTQRVCTKCHGTDQFSHLRQSKEKWSGTIDKMISKGLEASDADLDEVTEYLAASFPAPPAKDAPAAAAPDKK
jgi:mono/diheme cytochrome c family protein